MKRDDERRSVAISKYLLFIFRSYIWKIKLLPILFSTIFGKIVMKFRVIAKKDKLEPLSLQTYIYSQ